MEYLTSLWDWMTSLPFTVVMEQLGPFVQAFFVLVIGFPLTAWLSRRGRNYAAKKYTQQHGLIVGKIIFYTGLVIITVTVLNELGFSIEYLLGAAGIVGVALGFASQTSVSNVISGLFLVAEKPFVVGDLIQVGDKTGLVLSIDTLSIKMRMFNNNMVRIPNETLIKTDVINLTKFPIRRVDLGIGVAYKEDMARVKEILLEEAHKNPMCLEEPEPQVFFQGYGNSSVDMMLAAWAEKTQWFALKNALLEQIKRRFDEEGIEIPFPHLSLYTGSVTDPLPIRLLQEPPAPPSDSGGESSPAAPPQPQHPSPPRQP